MRVLLDWTRPFEGERQAAFEYVVQIMYKGTPD